MDIDYHLLQDAASEAGLDNDDLTTDYEGRGRTGTCVGITVETQSDFNRFLRHLNTAICNAGLDNEEDLIERFENARSDGMGRRIIFYWPGVHAIGAPEWDEDEN